MKCPKCKASIPEWKKGCVCGFKFDFRKYPLPPKQIGLVNDYEAVIGGEYMGKLIKLSSDLERRSGIEIIVTVIGTTKPMPPENYAFYLFNRWGLGKKKHEAILILVSMFERRVETEIGYGLEDRISEEFTEKLLDETIVPFFKQSKYGEGLYEGVKKLTEEISKRLA